MNERFKELRKVLGYSQQEFGNLLGLTKSGVCDIESGRRAVNERHIIMLKNHGVSEKWIRTGEGNMFVKESANKQIALMLADIQQQENDSFKKRLVAALAQLDDAGWDYLEKLIDSIQEKK